MFHCTSGKDRTGMLAMVLNRLLKRVDQLTQDPSFHVKFRCKQGDIVLINNYSIGHSRGAFEDDDDPDLGRALLRSLIGSLPGKGVGMSYHRSQSPPADRSAFAGYPFPPDVIMLAVRWYLRYRLSYRDVEELLAECVVEVDHVTIYRWVQRFTPR